jgi:hypothetical protein
VEVEVGFWVFGLVGQKRAPGPLSLSQAPFPPAPPPPWGFGAPVVQDASHNWALLPYGRGAPKKNKIESDVYLADDKWGRYVPSFFLIFFLRFSLWRFCAFLKKGS